MDIQTNSKIIYIMQFANDQTLITPDKEHLKYMYIGIQSNAYDIQNYLEVKIEGDGLDKKEIRQRVAQDRKAVNQLNFI